MYLTTANNDNNLSVVREYSFSERDEAQEEKVKLTTGLLDIIVSYKEKNNISKIIPWGELYHPTNRLFYRDYSILVKRPRELSILIAVGAKHYRKATAEGIHSKTRVRIENSEPIFPLDLDQDEFVLNLKDYLLWWENMQKIQQEK